MYLIAKAMTASNVSRLKYKICFLFLTFLLRLANGEKFEGDSCQMKSVNGVCKLASQCPELETAVRAGMFSTRDIVNCGYTTREEIICCPTGESVTTEISKNTATTPTPVKSSTTISPRTNDRPAIVACREIESGRDPSLSFHVLDGTPVELKEFPHMAAIGYRSIGNDDGPYDYRCGGTLIAKRFVLTAAHCVNSRESQPAVVLLGLVNINDADERQFSEEIKIRRVHIHDDYSSSRTYHDVAVLELEREVTYTEYIYPTCLYTELTDPPPPFQKQVYVSGWGRIRTGSREKSGILLKAKLEVVPVSQCNASYVDMGLNRRIDVGVMNSQMCAHDPGLTKDACEGDSGGPLLMVEDEAFRKYKVIGIISAGFSCGSATPGLYARVGAYLDYIESIVWPNTAG